MRHLRESAPVLKIGVNQKFEGLIGYSSRLSGVVVDAPCTNQDSLSPRLPCYFRVTVRELISMNLEEISSVVQCWATMLEITKVNQDDQTNGSGSQGHLP